MNIIKIAVFVFASVQMFSQDSSNQEFLQRINELRLQKNVEPLSYDTELKKFAKKWGDFLLKEFKSHSDSSIHAIGNVDKKFLHIKYNERFHLVLKKEYMMSIGENLFFQMGTIPLDDIVARAFSGWKYSTSHCMQMVDSEYTHVAFYSCYDPIRRRYVCISVYAEKKPRLHSKK